MIPRLYHLCMGLCVKGQPGFQVPPATVLCFVSVWVSSQRKVGAACAVTAHVGGHLSFVAPRPCPPPCVGGCACLGRALPWVCKI